MTTWSNWWDDESVRFKIWRWSVGFGLAIFVLLGYMALTVFNLHRFEVLGMTPVTLWTVWDAQIPFWPHAFWPYSGYYVLVFAPVFFVRTRRQLADMAFAYVIVAVVGWLSWVLWPVRMVYPPLNCSGLACDLVAGLRQSDGGFNVMPSLHVAHSVLVWRIFASMRSRLTPLIGVLATGVIVSTVLLKQHYLIDVPAGALLGAASWTLSQRLMPSMAAAWDERPAWARIGSGA